MVTGVNIRNVVGKMHKLSLCVQNITNKSWQGREKAAPHI
ncbi:MAG: hypothetical protein ACJAV1_003814 [Paraglaciecola sp.]